MNFHLVHIVIPQGGTGAVRKRILWFQLSKFLDSKRCIIRIKNKDYLCLARALVTEIARQGQYPDWNTIRHRRTL